MFCFSHSSGGFRQLVRELVSAQQTGVLDHSKVAESSCLLLAHFPLFWTHGLFNMMRTSSTRMLEYLCSKILPLDRDGVRMINRGMRCAAQAMVALRQGCWAIESFARQDGSSCASPDKTGGLMMWEVAVK